MENRNEETVGKTFIEFLTILVKYRRFIFVFVLVTTIGATTYSLLSPKWYMATASVLPAENTDMLGALSGLSNIARNFSSSKGLAALTKPTSESDKFIAMLRSATVTGEMITKYDLRKEYGLETTPYEKVVKAWQENFVVELQDEGNLTISVYDKDPATAAIMANYLVKRLNEMNTVLSVANAKMNRAFIEKRYNKNLHDIDSLKKEMEEFQKKTGVVVLPEQLESTIRTMSSIYSDLYARDIEYNVLKNQYNSESAPPVVTAKKYVDEIQLKIDKLNEGLDNSQKNSKIVLPFNNAPELAGKYFKIYKDLQIQYSILEIITPLFETAKIEEQKNAPSVIALDSAITPTMKARPKGSVYALVAFVFSLLSGIVISFSREFFNKLKIADPEKHDFIVGWIKFKNKG